MFKEIKNQNLNEITKTIKSKHFNRDNGNFNSLENILRKENTNKMEKEIRVVTIGGGSGSFQLLLALKNLPNVVISAIVTTADNGGSSGILRTIYGILPPGDIRNCLVALSKETIAWRKIFSYRFDEKLNKHSLGNLIIAALIDLYGSFRKAIDEAHNLLGIEKHRVIPVTYSKVHLKAKFSNSHEILGEHEIFNYAHKTKAKIVDVSLYNPDNQLIIPNPKAIEHIIKADFIIFGPGSLFTSIIPNLKVPDIVKSIEISKAKKIFVVNVMTEAETKGYKVNDFVNVLERYVKLDYIIINSRKPSKEILEKYAKEGKEWVEALDNNDKRAIFADLINEQDIVRHDPEKLSQVLDWIFLREKFGIKNRQNQ